MWSKKHLRAAGVVSAMTPHMSFDQPEVDTSTKKSKKYDEHQKYYSSDNNYYYTNKNKNNKNNKNNNLAAKCVDVRGPDGLTPLMLAACRCVAYSLMS